jgi:signal transduction histidine kinase
MYKKDLKTDRILLAIGIVIYAAWIFIYKNFLPVAIDPFSLRIVGVCLMLVLLILSYTSNSVKRYFTYFLYVLIVLVTIQQCYITILNNFSSEFLLLFIVLNVTLSAYFKKPLHLLSYAIFSIVAIVICFFFPVSEPAISFGFFTSSVISINALIVPIFTSRLRIMEKLAQKIEEANKSAAELQRKSDELTRSNNELQQFAYVASHDLQEPLRMVTSYVQLLEDRYKDKLDKDAKEFIEFAVDGTRRMRSLIQSLLEYSRVNKIRPFEQVDMNQLLAGILQEMEMETEIQSTGATVKVDKLSPVNGDSVQLTQLFRNLVLNAIKFRDPTKKPEIYISERTTSEGHLFSVKDNGIGIAKEYSEKIFVIFQRLHSREKYQGTGMGLAICKKIVEHHGGKIWVESEPGQGATFYFTIKNGIV